MPQVSVIMPVFNGERFLAESIESILAQTFTDFEFIIVDDASQDRSLEIIRACQARDSRIRLIEFAQNEGHANVRNRAISLAKGEFIASMDCDDVSLPERLKRQVNYLKNSLDIGVLGTGVQAVSEDLQPLYPFNLPEPHALIAFNLFVGSFFIHPSVMMRRELLESIGGYEPSRRTAIDVELWSRLMWRTRFANLPETLLLYRRHDAQHHITRDAALNAQAWEVRARLLERLWGEAPPTTLVLFERMRKDEQLSWRERRRAHAGMVRLLNALINAGIIDSADRDLASAHIRRRLEGTTPRLWQMFCHWRRHRFGGKNSDVNPL